MSFFPSMDELRQRLDWELDACLEDRASYAHEDALLDELMRIVRAGGKRLRPMFCYWGYRAAGGPDDDRIVRVGAGLELLHTFAVVHDDIMDRSDERRGVPTINARMGSDFALLAGDLALVLADACLMGASFEPAMLLRGFGIYSRMRREVIAGQYLDLSSSRQARVSVDDARRIAVLKSGRYSVAEPLMLGAALAAAPDALLEGLSSFGEPLGEAFQLRDDLLGTFGDASALGKPVDLDARQGKRHVLYALTMEMASERDAAWLADRWGAGALTQADLERIRTVMVVSGARRATEDFLADLVRRSRTALSALDIAEDARQALATLAQAASYRAV